MPDGYGFYRQARPLPAAQSALAGLRKPVGGAELGTAALTAVERLAPHPGTRSRSRRQPQPPTGGGTDTIPLIALAIGAVLIAVAWTASLRARPLQVGRRKASST